MKRLFNILTIVALGAIISLTSCSDQLALDPHSAVSPSSVTEDDIPQLRVGMYWKVQENPTRSSYILMDLLGGNLTQKNATSTQALINTILNPQSEIVTVAWQGFYKALYQVNNVYDIAQGLPAGDVRDQVLGECHYFRAYIHLQLVTRFGDVPLLKKNVAEDVPRTPAAEVWQFIYDELDLAIELLGANSNYYYLSADAATALKARVALYMGKNNEAATLAESIIANSRYQLDSFENIFRASSNTETIFAFECLTADGSLISISNLFYSYNHPNKGTYSYQPAPDVMTLYEDNDLRKEISVTVLENLNFINKYPSGQVGTDPVIISRLAEMYLISAEAQGLAGGGLVRLNQLRNKRGLENVNPTNDKAFLEAILLERRKELLAENHAWYDYVRTGTAVEKLGIQEYQTLLPIPESEMQNNALLKPQNPQY